VEVREALHRAARVLRSNGRDRGEDGEQEERQLLDDELHGTPIHPPQRPEVEE